MKCTFQDSTEDLTSTTSGCMRAYRQCLYPTKLILFMQCPIFDGIWLLCKYCMYCIQLAIYINGKCNVNVPLIWCDLDTGLESKLSYTELKTASDTLVLKLLQKKTLCVMWTHDVQLHTHKHCSSNVSKFLGIKIPKMCYIYTPHLQSSSSCTPITKTYMNDGQWWGTEHKHTTLSQ